MDQFTEEVENRIGIRETDQCYYQRGNRVFIKEKDWNRFKKIQSIEQFNSSFRYYVNSPWGKLKLHFYDTIEHSIPGDNKIYRDFQNRYQSISNDDYMLLNNNRDVIEFVSFKDIPNNSELLYKELEYEPDSITIMCKDYSESYRLVGVKKYWTIAELIVYLNKQVPAHKHYEYICCEDKKYSSKDKATYILDTSIINTYTIFIENTEVIGHAAYAFNSMKRPFKRNFSTSAPRWRWVSEGLSFIGICKNQACVAFEQQVICNKGFGVFPVKKKMKQAECVMCKKNCLEIKGCGFYDCSYSYKGLLKNYVDKNGSGIADNTGYTEFFSNETVEWRFLMIEALERKEN